MAWFHVEPGEQIAISRWSLGFLASSARAVPMGCERKDMASADSDLVRQINLVTADEILVLSCLCFPYINMEIYIYGKIYIAKDLLGRWGWSDGIVALKSSVVFTLIQHADVLFVSMLNPASQQRGSFYILLLQSFSFLLESRSHDQLNKKE